jgi:hypothetical protein
LVFSFQGVASGDVDFWPGTWIFHLALEASNLQHCIFSGFSDMKEQPALEHSDSWLSDNVNNTQRSSCDGLGL